MSIINNPLFGGLLSNIPVQTSSQFADAELSKWHVASIVRDICRMAGIDDTELDLSTLEGSVYGLIHSSSDEAFKTIEELAIIYLFDVVGIDGTLAFPRRGGSPVATLVEDDMIDQGENEAVKVSTRKDSISVPRVLHLEYYDIDGGLSPDKQTSDRSLDNRAKGEVKSTTCVIMDSRQAAISAVVSHKIRIEEQAGDYEFSLPDSYIWLTVGDVIFLDGIRLRIIEAEIDDGQQNYKAVRDRASAYISAVPGVPAQQPIDPPSLIIGDTVLHFIDSPIISDRDDRLGFYVSVGRASDGWNGALVELSIDGGETFTDARDATIEAIQGELVTELASASIWSPDSISSCRVRIDTVDELEPATLREMLNRQNLAIVGDELINFGNVEQVGPNEWELDYFLRGRRGTAAVTHPAGTRFVVMDRSWVAFEDAELYQLGQPLTFRVTSFGTGTSIEQTVTYTGQSQTERRPEYLRAVRDGGNIVITWQGVGKLGGRGRIGLGAYHDGYRVWVNGTPQDTTAQTLTVTDPGGTVTIEVAQLNQITGAGPVNTVTL